MESSEYCAKRHKSNNDKQDGEESGMEADDDVGVSSTSNSVSQSAALINKSINNSDSSDILNTATLDAESSLTETSNVSTTTTSGVSVERSKALNSDLDSSFEMSCTVSVEETDYKLVTLEGQLHTRKVKDDYENTEEFVDKGEVDSTTSTPPTFWRKTKNRTRNYRKPTLEDADSNNGERDVAASCSTVMNKNANEPSCSSKVKPTVDGEKVIDVSTKNTSAGEQLKKDANEEAMINDSVNASDEVHQSNTISRVQQDNEADSDTDWIFDDVDINDNVHSSDEAQQPVNAVSQENENSSDGNAAIQENNEVESDAETDWLFDETHNSDDIDSDDDNDDEDDDDSYIARDSKSREAENEEALKDVMNKPKPIYTWNSTYELMRREHGLHNNASNYSRHNDVSNGFTSRFYSSRHVVERMKLSHCLRKHKGCVNCLNFNRSGDLLCTGSDDTHIIIWNWALNEHKFKFKSGHIGNIFQAKFIDNANTLDIVSASRDGQVRRCIVPPSGGRILTDCLYKHRGAVHKIVVCPQSPHEIISVGEDGHIYRRDLRVEEEVERLKTVIGLKNRKVRLLSISHHPFAQEICVSGSDNFVRIYDKRNMSKTVQEMCPEILEEITSSQVTCAVYNSTGSEVLASYSDDHIYLFDNTAYKSGEYLHRYRGHFNHKTIKGVNFFGPNSEYVISGSDCGHIFFWDKNTEAILNFMPADTMGVVNCLEPHPTIPVLATSGLDHNIKIWTPSSNTYPPDLSKLELCVKRNLRKSVIEDMREFGHHQFRYFIEQFLRDTRSRPRIHLNRTSGSDDHDDSDSGANISRFWSSNSSSSSSSSGADDDESQVEGVQCRTQ